MSKDMNPVVLIASHKRINVTTENIRTLYNQFKAMPTVVLVVSNQQEYDYYRTKFLNMHLVLAPNNPLGMKWQIGVDYCRKIGADPLIILGSDDFLSHSAIHNATNILKYHDFIGFKSWSVYHTSGLIHRLSYSHRMIFKNFTLGAGRFYRKSLLDAFDWKLFDTTLEKGLDNLGHFQVEKYVEAPFYVNAYDERAPWILSLKGDWHCMNDFNKLLDSRNITKLPDQMSKKELLSKFDLRLNNL